MEPVRSSWYYDKTTTKLPAWALGVELYKWGFKQERRCITVKVWRTEWTWEWSR